MTKEFLIEHAKRETKDGTREDVPHVFIVHTSRPLGEMRTDQGVGMEAFARELQNIEGIDVVEQGSRYSFSVMVGKCFDIDSVKEQLIELIKRGQSDIEVVSRPPLSLHS